MVTRLVQEVQDGHRLELVDELFHPDYRPHHSQRPATSNGGSRRYEAFKHFYGGMLRAFPDLCARIDERIAERDLVVTRKTFRGTMTGSLWGSPPTGRSFQLEVIDIMRIAEDRIAEHWAQLDVLALARQLGISPPGGTREPSGDGKP